MQVFKGLKNGVADVAIKRLIQPDVLHLRLFQRVRAFEHILHGTGFVRAVQQSQNLDMERFCPYTPTQRIGYI